MVHEAIDLIEFIYNGIVNADHTLEKGSEISTG